MRGHGGVALAEKSLRRQRDENKVRGFTQVIMCPDVDAGLTSLIQTAGLGGLAPNTLLLGWSRNWDKDPARAPRMCKLLLEAQAYKMAVVAVKGVEHVPDSAGRMFRPMDLWWVMHDGGLQLLLQRREEGLLERVPLVRLGAADGLDLRLERVVGDVARRPLRHHAVFEVRAELHAVQLVPYFFCGASRRLLASTVRVFTPPSPTS